MKHDWSHYVALRESGSTPREVWNRSVAEELNCADSVRMIRAVFGLGLAEAKEVMLQAGGMKMPLEDYQRDVILLAIKEAERQGLFDDDS